MRRVLLIAGEASGDLHGSLLARALLERQPDLELHGVGGQRMAEAGVRLFLRSEDLAVVGVMEVLAHARKVLSALRTVRARMEQLRPDLLIPIDYPDFNLRLLPAARRLGVPVVYYISPQVWAWRQGRVRLLQRHVRRMIVIFPFEESFYRSHGVEVCWVGHPLVDVVSPAEEPFRERARLGLPAGDQALGLLPGSRRSEIRRIAPVLAAAADALDARRAAAGLPPILRIVGQAPGITAADLAPLLERSPRPALLVGLDALRAADYSIVASGTVTLEATLLGRPVAVVYRMHPATFALVRRLVKVEHIAMANLIAGRRLVPEFVQGEARPEAVASAVWEMLGDAERLEMVRQAMLENRARLGEPGAAGRAAEEILRILHGARPG